MKWVKLINYKSAKINIVTEYKFSELGKAFSATLTSHTSGTGGSATTTNY